MTLHLNDEDLALMLLEPVFANMSAAWLGHVKIDPDLDTLRDRPRFRKMMAAAEARLATPPGPRQ